MVSNWSNILTDCFDVEPKTFWYACFFINLSKLNMRCKLTCVMMESFGIWHSELKLNPNWHERWYFYLLVLFESDFVSWIFIKKFHTCSTSIELIWHPTKLIESYKKMSLGGAKDEHLSCFHSSCQWGLTYLWSGFGSKVLCWTWLFHAFILDFLLST